MLCGDVQSTAAWYMLELTVKMLLCTDMMRLFVGSDAVEHEGSHAIVAAQLLLKLCEVSGVSLVAVAVASSVVANAERLAAIYHLELMPNHGGHERARGTN